MTTQVPEHSQDEAPEMKESREVQGRWVAGVALVAIGLIALVANFIESPSMGALIIPSLALIFILWGIAVRQVGLLIPGGILAGISLGIYLMEGPLAYLEGAAEGGVFLVAFALGWGLITLLSAFVGDRTHWWPLIPGGILGAIGTALLVGGPALVALEWIGRLWPLGLVAFGAYLLLRKR